MHSTEQKENVERKSELYSNSTNYLNNNTTTSNTTVSKVEDKESNTTTSRSTRQVNKGNLFMNDD